MKLQTAIVEVEVVDGVPIPRAVLLGDQRLENVVEARALFDNHAPLSITVQILVQKVRTIFVSPGCHMETGSKPRREKVVDSGGAGVSIVGQEPALGYTVQALIDRLKTFPKNAQVGMNVGPGSNLEILSLYQASEEPQTVWFDLGEA